jgi:biotin transporter BioY
MRSNTFGFMLSYPQYSVIISLLFSENEAIPEYELNL